MPRRIDLNCDLGEGCGNDAAIIPLISSANIACGAHAGDETSMRETLRLCRQFGVAVGAHPGYADREHFGRRELDLPFEDIALSLREQLLTLATLAREEGVCLVHVKPHGALYNQAARDSALADIVAASVRDFDPRLILVGLAASELPKAGRRIGLRVAHEAFADRRYRADGSLAPRNLGGAVITDVEVATSQGLAIAKHEAIEAIDGAVLNLGADTICLHGDGAQAELFARHLRKALKANHMSVVAMDPSIR